MRPSMDMEIIRQLFTEYLEGCRILGLSKEVTDEDTIREILAKLPPLRIGSDGRLMEWQEEAEEMEPGHRHISHLYALHPGREITEEKRRPYRLEPCLGYLFLCQTQRGRQGGREH